MARWAPATVARWVLVSIAALSLASCSHGRSVAGTYVARAGGLEIALTLNDDGTWTGLVGTGQGGGTYTVEGDTVVLQQTGSTEVQRATIEGDRLILRHGAVSLTFVRRSPEPATPTAGTSSSGTGSTGAGSTGAGSTGAG
ncbi:MAG: hypothetical protein M3Q23_15055 [Actinomycetota bacterium]|nr:hypothetical protein [Actinomycetota bacterium]